MTREIVVLAEDLGFTEGPVVLPDGNIVVTSITRGHVYLVYPGGGSKLLADVGGGANGAAVDADGILYIAQNGGRWAATGPVWPPDSIGGVQRIYPDGSHDWLTREPIAPNDLCLGPDGMLYVTDPTRSQVINDGRVWRINPNDGGCELLRSFDFFPNGIAFDSDDDLWLLATDCAKVYRTRVDGGTLADPVEVFQLRQGKPDGMAFTADGDVVLGAVDGDYGSVQTWSPAGELLDEFRPGPGIRYTNVAFDYDGGLVISASDEGKVLLVPGWGEGLPLYPFR
jgi:gluconolactonase